MWTNKVFEIIRVNGGYLARCTDSNGIFLFRWRIYYDVNTFETFDVPVGIIEKFETFKALCRQFETPGDAEAWYLKRIKDNGR